MRYSPHDAMASAQEIAAAAREWQQVAPPRTRATWTCSACPFTTSSSEVAQEHALTPTGFAHVLYAAAGQDKRGRRIHSPDGRVVLCMARVVARVAQADGR